MRGFKSLKTKLVFWISVGTVAVYVTITGYISSSNYRKIAVNSENQLRAETERYALEIDKDVDGIMEATRALASTLVSFKSSMPEGVERTVINQMVRQLLVENPYFPGAAVVCEPNAFDRDDQYRDTLGYDHTGRLNIHWVRDGQGELSRKTAVPDDYAADFYRIAHESKQRAAIEPYEHEIEGRKALRCHR